MSTHFPDTKSESPQVFSKTDRRYWKDRVELRTRITRGITYTDEDYSVQIQLHGKRQRFPLGTPNKAAAQEQAALIYRTVMSVGWEDTLAKYGGAKHQVRTERELRGGSLGALIAAYEELSPARRSSQETYIKAIRCIYAELNGINVQLKHRSTGKDKGSWQQQVDALLISSVTPEMVAKWRRASIAGAKTESATRNITTTINSKIRNAKALFSKRCLEQMSKNVALPAILPFQGVRLDNCMLPKYESRLDAGSILAKAKLELKNADPSAYCVLLLALNCGLRRAEIDNLLWESIDLTTGVLHVEGNDFYQLKSQGSQGAIDLGDEIIAELSALRKKSNSEFVISSDQEARRHEGSGWYRCEDVFTKLIKWLRKNGVKSKKPLHELRKEVGSIIARDYGIFEASRFLRHRDIRVTASIYVDKKQKVVPKF
jgi:integrase